MQIVYVLTNSSGLLLGMYRDRQLADDAMQIYKLAEPPGIPKLFLYEVNSTQVNKPVGNKFCYTF